MATHGQTLPGPADGSISLDSRLFHSLPPNSSDSGHFDPGIDPYNLMGMGRVDTDLLDFRKKLTYYLMGIGGSIVCCLGTIANALSVAVLTRRIMKSSTYVYLAALAICDSLVLFFTLLLILKDTKPPDSPHQLDQFHAVLFPFVHPTAIVFQVSSIWLTLAFTVDRYIMICHPFSAERMCRRSRARKVVLGIYIGGFLFNIPKYLEYYTTTQELTLANSSQVFKVYGVETTTIGNNEVFREVVHSWMYLIFVCGIPFLTLVILNAFLIRAVHLSRLKGKEINVREKHRNDTTIMLIGVIIIFLICQGPALVSRMMYAFKPGTTKNRAAFTLNEVGSFLVILNSAINIVPYYLFGRKFRSEFWRIFCTCFFDKDELRRIVRSYSLSIDHRRLSQYNMMEMNGMDNSKTNAAGIGVYNPTGHPRNASTQPAVSHRAEPSVVLKPEGVERVAVPLIHNSATAGQSLSRNTSGRDKNGLSNPSPRSLPGYSSSSSFCPDRNAAGHVMYMSVASTPNISDSMPTYDTSFGRSCV